MGSLTLNGSSSGQITIAAPAAAGTNTLTLPASTGTVALTSQIVAATGTLIRAPQFLTSGTSYTTPSNCTSIYVELVGAGGGGGGTTANGRGGGGGGGAYCAIYVTVSPSTAYTYAIGGAGTGGAAGNNAGTNGGNTTLTIGATTYTANGGKLGSGSGGTVAASGVGGTASNGTVNLTGGDGGIFGSPAMGGFAVGPFFGYNFGAYLSAASNGLAATSYGCGGGGGVSTGANQSGGNGFQGCIRIWEYS